MTKNGRERISYFHTRSSHRLKLFNNSSVHRLETCPLSTLFRVIGSKDSENVALNFYHFYTRKLSLSSVSLPLNITLAPSFTTLLTISRNRSLYKY